MKQSFISRTLVVLAVMLVLCTGMLLAQTSKGTITGVVTDVSDAVVPNAQVTATAAQGGETRSAISGPNGQFLINALTPGLYNVTVNAPGFAKINFEKVEVKAASSATINAKLQVSASSETVTVEASAGQELQTISGEISHNISSAEITRLPTLNLNPISLALTEPGVVAPSSREDFSNGVSFSANGTRPRANNFLMDGFDNNDTSIGGQALQPQNAEAVGEVVVLTNSYAAEFGRGGGSVTNVTFKGGSNQFHGSAWELHQNSALNAWEANDKYFNTPKAPSRENTYGFSFGGPAVKDKLFFFGTSQWDRTRGSQNGAVITLPTVSGYNTLKVLADGGNANVQRLLSAIGNLRGTESPYSIDLSNGQSVEVGSMQRQVGMINNARQWMTRVDWLPTQKDTFTFRYLMDDNFLSPDFFNNNATLPGFDSMQGGRSQNLGILQTHTFSSNLVNEFRFSYGRINFGFGVTPEAAANPMFSGPEVTIAGFLTYGFPSGMPQSRLHNTYQYQDALNWNKGTHAIKVGFDLARIQEYDGVPFNSRGTMAFMSGGTYIDGDGEENSYSALANYVDDYTGQGTNLLSRVWGTPDIKPFVFSQGYYVQDAWRLRSNFTLNYGVRYEFSGTPSNVLDYPAIDRDKYFQDPFPTRYAQKADKNNFAPRVSFAYTPKFWEKFFGQEKTVIRAGYGMFYDGLFNNIMSNSAAAAPNAISRSRSGGYSGRGLAGAWDAFQTLPNTLSPTATVQSIDANLVAPITHQWNLDIQRELPGNFILTTAYVGTRGIRLFVNDQINPVDYLTGTRTNSGRGSTAIRDNGGDSIYHGLNVKLDRRFTKGMFLRTAYTYSKLIDTGSEVFATTGWSSYPMILNNRAADRGLSAYDRRQRLVISYVYQIPNIKAEGMVKTLTFPLRDWEISGTTSFQSGAPETIAVGSIDMNGDGVGNDRPILNNAGAPITSWAVEGSQYDPSLAGYWFDGYKSWFTTDPLDPLTPEQLANYHWLVGPYGTNGNVGRNTMIGHGRQDWTFSLARTFRMPYAEGHQVQFRTELFNPFNHPNLGNVSYVLTENYFANSEVTRAGNRQIRFWLKYSF